MEIHTFLQECAEKDPTWETARDITFQTLKVSDNLTSLIRNVWNNNFDIEAFIRFSAFSGISTTSLFNAAQIKNIEGKSNSEIMHEVIDILGLRYATLVIGVSACVKSILLSKPPVGWKRLLQEMMDDINIGYCFGERSEEMGKEGGALVGFSRMAGLGLLMAYSPKSFRKYQEFQHQKIKLNHEAYVELFGCEPYQVSAMLLQTLGYGVQAAVGATCGLSDLNIEQIELDLIAKKWRAAFFWIEALREGRNYPGDIEIRNAFPLIAPPAERDKKNPKLEMLHFDVSKIRQEGSPWTWHLPEESYSAVQEKYGL